MARKQQGAGEALEEIQSTADRMAEWIQGNLRLVAAVSGGVLLLVGAISYWGTQQAGQEGDAAADLAQVRDEYLAAMGAAPGALEVPELASPAAAERIRQEYAGRFAEVADANTGTVAGTLARLEVGSLAARAGDSEGALALWEQALDEAPASDPLRGLVLQRVAQALETLERWPEASARHEEAGNLAGFPPRAWALADAARCSVGAGERERALALYELAEAADPDLRLPDHQRVQLRELRATSGG